MDELIRRLTERVGLNEDQARKAAQTAIEFLKQRLPSSVAGQLDGVLGGGGSGAAGMAEKAAGMFGKKD